MRARFRCVKTVSINHCRSTVVLLWLSCHFWIILLTFVRRKQCLWVWARAQTWSDSTAAGRTEARTSPLCRRLLRWACGCVWRTRPPPTAWPPRRRPTATWPRWPACCRLVKTIPVFGCTVGVRCPATCSRRTSRIWSRRWVNGSENGGNVKHCWETCFQTSDARVK